MFAFDTKTKAKKKEQRTKSGNAGGKKSQHFICFYHRLQRIYNTGTQLSGN